MSSDVKSKFNNYQKDLDYQCNLHNFKKLKNNIQLVDGGKACIILQDKSMLMLQKINDRTYKLTNFQLGSKHPNKYLENLVQSLVEK